MSGIGCFECKGVKGSGHLCFNIPDKMIVPESYKRILDLTRNIVKQCFRNVKKMKT